MKVTIRKGSFEFTFDKMGETASSGFLMGVEIVPRPNDQTMLQNETEEERIKERTMDINVAHHLFGHASKTTIKNTAKHYGWTLTGNWNKCENCVLAKIRQRNLQKTSPPTTVKGERLYMDISSVKQRSYGGSKFWCLIVDQHTGMKWSIFFEKEK